MNKSLIALVLLLSVCGGARADDAGIIKCRGIANAAARLACYDALAGPAANANTDVTRPAVQPAPRPAQAVPAPLASATAPAVQPKSDQFGLENRPSVVMVDAIESHIPGRFEGWEAKSSIKLANGQVWQIADDSSRYVTMNDPKVRIRRGALGSFYLEFEKINHSPRVKRVQ